MGAGALVHPSVPNALAPSPPGLRLWPPVFPSHTSCGCRTTAGGASVSLCVFCVFSSFSRCKSFSRTQAGFMANTQYTRFLGDIILWSSWVLNSRYRLEGSCTSVPLLCQCTRQEAKYRRPGRRCPAFVIRQQYHLGSGHSHMGEGVANTHILAFPPLTHRGRESTSPGCCRQGL